jgi:hypothetical protein
MQNEQQKSKMRLDFEDWYIKHSFDIERYPLGCRESSLQWEAWKAAIENQKKIERTLSAMNSIPMSRAKINIEELRSISDV